MVEQVVMSSRSIFRNKTLMGVIGFLAWSVVFGIVYAQSPVYTSNQNQYFLHGIAHAGEGYLAHDWLANTIDPAPMFSLLVEGTYLISRNGALFYFYYAILMGIYLFSLFGISDLVFDLRRSRSRSLLFMVVFLGVHSALAHYLFSRVLGTEKPFLLEGGVAGQRLLGQVFQPSTFGVFLLLSIYLFLKNRSFLSMFSFLVAVTFHSVYLLSATVLTLGYLWVIFRKKRNLKSPALFATMALLLVAPVTAYTFFVFKPTSMELIRQSNEILVNYRIPSHAIVSQWLDWSVAVQVMIVVAALVVVRKHHLFPILGILVLGATILTVVQVVIKSNTLALVFPWRLSVVIVPISTSILLAFSITKILDAWKADPTKVEHGIRIPCMVLLAGLIFVGAVRFQIELARKNEDPAKPLMAFVSTHKAENETFLVPLKMEDFRLATGAPIFVDFKSIPYRDSDVLEWYRRYHQASLFYQNADCTLLPVFQEQGITHVVLPVEFPVNCTGIRELYRDSAYGLYLIEN
jgi:hypothetical protein